MTTPPSPGTPYHRLARTERHRWWRPVLGTVFALAGTFTMMCLLYGAAEVVGTLTDRPLGPDDTVTFGPTVDTALLLLSIAVALPLVLLAAPLAQARPVGTVSSVLGRLRWRWLGLCALLALPTILLLFGGGMGLIALTGDLDGGGDGTGTGWPGWPGFLGALVMLVALVPLQAAAEEYVFRGWLLQAVGAFFRTPWPAIGIQAVLFAAAHGWGTRWGFAELVLTGALTGWLTVRTGGLEAAVALHVVNNLVAFIASAATGDLASEETAADAPWQLLVVSVLVHLGYAGAVLWLARRREVATLVPAAATPHVGHANPAGYPTQPGYPTPPGYPSPPPPAPSGYPVGAPQPTAPPATPETPPPPAG